MNKNKPQWVRDYESYEANMGPPIPTSARPVEILAGCLILSLRLGIFVAFCVLVYLIGWAIVG